MTDLICCELVENLPVPAVLSDKVACLLCQRVLWRSRDKVLVDAKPICRPCLSTLPKPAGGIGIENLEEVKRAFGVSETGLLEMANRLMRDLWPGLQG